jgi:Flp pilus assembly protein TadG
MSVRISQLSTRCIHRCARRFAECRSGIAALEFALIAPIMLMMFVGVVELSQAITVDRRVNHVASSTADLVARQKQVSTTLLENYMNIVTPLMHPYDAAPMKLTITNVYSTSAAPTTYKVCWFYNHNGGATGGLTKGGNWPDSIPAGLLQGGTSVVIVDVEYNYTPTVMFGKTYVNNGYPLKERFYLKPRLSSVIQFTPDPVCST